MPITFHPRPGMVLYCDFDAGGFMPPEMVKTRPVVTLSRNHAELATVVPLSGTRPEKPQPYHYAIPPNVLPPSIDRKGQWWAKCDCVTTVAFRRLEPVKTRQRGPDRRRVHESRVIAEACLREIRLRILDHLCMKGLTGPA